MTISRTDPTITSNYIRFPYVVKTTKWQETTAKVTAIAAHILIGILTLGIFTAITLGKYFTEKHNVALIQAQEITHVETIIKPPVTQESETIDLEDSLIDPEDNLTIDKIPEKSNNGILDLPDGLLVNIFRFLDQGKENNNLCPFGLTCKKLYRVGMSDAFWGQKLRQQFPHYRGYQQKTSDRESLKSIEKSLSELSSDPGTFRTDHLLRVLASPAAFNDFLNLPKNSIAILNFCKYLRDQQILLTKEQAWLIFCCEEIKLTRNLWNRPGILYEMLLYHAHSPEFLEKVENDAASRKNYLTIDETKGLQLLCLNRDNLLNEHDIEKSMEENLYSESELLALVAVNRISLMDERRLPLIETLSNHGLYILSRLDLDAAYHIITTHHLASKIDSTKLTNIILMLCQTQYLKKKQALNFLEVHSHTLVPLAIANHEIGQELLNKNLCNKLDEADLTTLISFNKEFGLSILKNPDAKIETSSFLFNLCLADDDYATIILNGPLAYKMINRLGSLALVRPKFASIILTNEYANQILSEDFVKLAKTDLSYLQAAFNFDRHRTDDLFRRSLVSIATHSSEHLQFILENDADLFDSAECVQLALHSTKYLLTILEKLAVRLSRSDLIKLARHKIKYLNIVLGSENFTPFTQKEWIKVVHNLPIYITYALNGLLCEYIEENTLEEIIDNNIVHVLEFLKLATLGDESVKASNEILFMLAWLNKELGAYIFKESFLWTEFDREQLEYLKQQHPEYNKYYLEAKMHEKLVTGNLHDD